ncbi:colanic acid production tyrosine-protein kinase [Escherichia coli]|nr:colanic acid production tyrosine-protein kinase [Escherichia coli]
MTTKNMNTPPGSTQENEIDLLRLVGELWDHRKFIISVTALFTLIAVAYSLLSTPIYQADTLSRLSKNRATPFSAA